MGFFQNALRCWKTGACQILVPLRYLLHCVPPQQVLSSTPVRQGQDPWSASPGTEHPQQGSRSTSWDNHRAGGTCGRPEEGPRDVLAHELQAMIGKEQKQKEWTMSIDQMERENKELKEKVRNIITSIPIVSLLEGIGCKKSIICRKYAFPVKCADTLWVSLSPLISLWNEISYMNFLEYSILIITLEKIINCIVPSLVLNLRSKQFCVVLKINAKMSSDLAEAHHIL